MEDEGASQYKPAMNCSQNEVPVKDPVRTHGRGLGKRLTSSQEKAISQRNRHCSNCQGVGHDVQNYQASTTRMTLEVEAHRPRVPNELACAETSQPYTNTNGQNEGDVMLVDISFLD